MNKPIKVAQIGAFDLENYGDNLFPLVAYNELKTRMNNLTIDFFSPYGGKVVYGDMEFCIKGLIDIKHREMLLDYDVILIGGGDLVRFDEKVVNEHYKSQGCSNYSSKFKPIKAMMVHKPIFWRKKNPFIVWNAVGVNVTNRRKCRKIANNTDILTVRDSFSKKHLLKCKLNKEVKVVPDTALLISDILGNSEIKKYINFEPNKHVLKAKKNGKKILGFHCNKWYLKKSGIYDEISKVLLNFSRKHDLEVVLIPIGFCHGDLKVLKEINKLSGKSFDLIENYRDTIETALIISQCDYLVASSLHANITASSFGIPHLGINTLNWGKMSGFFEIIQRLEMKLDKWQDFDEKLNLLLQDQNDGAKDNVDKAKKNISDHFNLLTEKIKNFKLS